jgi:hypothetical protein
MQALVGKVIIMLGSFAAVRAGLSQILSPFLKEYSNCKLNCKNWEGIKSITEASCCCNRRLSASATHRSCPCAMVLNVSKSCVIQGLRLVSGWSTSKTRQTSTPKYAVIAALTGFVGSYMGSCFYLVQSITCQVHARLH